jgi:DNA (cytosine-5)-methyltransferase 1
MGAGMRVLDLFSGIGGFSLGLERAGMETVAFCEIEEYPKRVLAKHWPDIPIYNDVRTLTKERLDADGIGPIDVISGGYPCQPFSNAGKRRGKEDHRHLWPEVNRLISELRPTWFIGENVAGHVSMGLDQVLSDLEGQGYTWETFIIPACAVDAPHRRDRVWIAANSLGSGVRANAGAHGAGSAKSAKLQQENGESLPDDIEPARQVVANSDSKRGDRSSAQQREDWGEKFKGNNNVADDGCGGSERPRGEVSSSQRPARWIAEPGVGRVANGIPSRVDRLKGLGNAVVPQIPEIIGRAIMSLSISIDG